MATAESVKAKLQNLLTLANGTTGNTDATLTAAVNALIAGFGQGGGGGGVSAIASGKFTPAENVLEVTVNTGVENMNTFMLYAKADVRNKGVKAGFCVFIDNIKTTSNTNGVMVFTNNSGTGWSNIDISFKINVSESDGERAYWIVNNTRTTFYVNGDVKIKTSDAAGSCFGYFIGGVEYQWYAW